MILCFQFGIIYLYSVELFPTQLRGLAMGIASSVGRTSMALISILLLAAQIFDVHPLSFCFVFALASLPSIFFLPETKGKRLKN